MLVSSGAIALGLGELGERVRPTDTPSLQASAAVGQALLMRLYGDLFKKRGHVAAQILLTWDDFNTQAQAPQCVQYVECPFGARGGAGHQ